MKTGFKSRFGRIFIATTAVLVAGVLPAIALATTSVGTNISSGGSITGGSLTDGTATLTLGRLTGLAGNLAMGGFRVTGAGTFATTGNVHAQDISATGTATVGTLTDGVATLTLGRLTGLAGDLAMGGHLITGAGTFATTGNVHAQNISASGTATVGTLTDGVATLTLGRLTGLAGDLALGTFRIPSVGTINSTGDVNASNMSATGTITATTFIGSGASLTGVLTTNPMVGDLAMGGFRITNVDGITMNATGDVHARDISATGTVLGALASATNTAIAQGNGEEGAGFVSANVDAVTFNKASGVIVSSDLATGAAAIYTLTLTDSIILTANSHVFVSIQNGTNSTQGAVVTSVTPATGSAVIVIKNVDASALNGTLKVHFAVFN